MYDTAKVAGDNTYHGSGNIASKTLEGIEYVGKGGGSMLGASWDGFVSGFNQGRNVAENKPRSLEAIKQLDDPV